jgi:hypothetical protein
MEEVRGGPPAALSLRVVDPPIQPRRADRPSLPTSLSDWGLPWSEAVEDPLVERERLVMGMRRGLVLVVVGGLVLAAGGVASPAVGTGPMGRAQAMCYGREATIVGRTPGETIWGTAADDVIVGTAGPDVIYGLAGNDRICAGGGNDEIRPGPGNDRVKGGAGRDVILGADGNDLLKGGGGPDRINGNAGDDRLVGQRGDDYLSGDPGTDTIRGGPGVDTCFGETLTTCELPAAARDFESGYVGQEISTGHDAVSVITVGGSGTITDLNVGLVITHTYVGDLLVTLTHVDTGTSVTIIDHPGESSYGSGDFGCSGNNIDATLDDEASLPVEDQCRSLDPAISGSVRPNHPLSAFDGESLSGTWRLTVIDEATLDDGILVEWSLHFQT